MGPPTTPCLSPGLTPGTLHLQLSHTESPAHAWILPSNLASSLPTCHGPEPTTTTAPHPLRDTQLAVWPERDTKLAAQSRPAL